MATYKFSRFLAGSVRVGGLLALVVSILLVAASSSVVASDEGVVIALGATGVVISLLGAIVLAVFDAPEALQRVFPAGEPSSSLKRTDQSLRD